MKPHPARADIVTVKFWEGFEHAVDMNDVASRALPVKGSACDNPLRFLEIYNEGLDSETLRRQLSAHPRLGSLPRMLGYEEARRRFFPSLQGSLVDVGAQVDLPPFCWRDADPQKLCVSFTYNANAFSRILKNLAAEGKIPADQVPGLLDLACFTLAQIYKAGDFHVIRHINNNFNMYLISRVMEELVGPQIYSVHAQEPSLTRRSLVLALELAGGLASVPVLEKMALALGMGVAFVEQRLRDREGAKRSLEHSEKTAHGYFGKALAIDDRERLLHIIGNAAASGRPFVIAAILDDATETVLDLLWMQDLMQQFPHLHVNLLVNTAQVSINFASDMLGPLLAAPPFRRLAAESGRRFLTTRMYCPFISFQTNFLPPAARRAVEAADLVYVKGANFFETCQIPEKPTVHAFVVFGPVSRFYSGLEDYEAVFAYLPAGMAGYIHDKRPDQTVNLRQILASQDGGLSRLS